MPALGFELPSGTDTQGIMPTNLFSWVGVSIRPRARVRVNVMARVRFMFRVRVIVRVK